MSAAASLPPDAEPATTPPSEAPHRRLVPLVLSAALVAGGLLAVPALAPAEDAAIAGPVPARPVPPPSDPRAVALLRQAAAAGTALSWHGDEVVAETGRSATTSLLSVTHRAFVGSEVTVTGGSVAVGQHSFEPDDPALSGAPPASSPLALVDTGSEWASLVAGAYLTSVLTIDRVAGEQCTVLEAQRGDGSLAAKIWVSTDTGLALQRQLFDSGGRLQRDLTFTNLTVESSSDAHIDEGARAPQPATAGTAIPAAGLAAMRSATDGRSAPATLAGTMRLVEARSYRDDSDTSTPAATPTGAPSVTATVTAGDAVALTYSDGLSSMTITEYRGRLASELPAGWRRTVRASAVVHVLVGTPQRIAWSDKQTVYSMVSDADNATIDAALAGLPRQAASGSYGHRMRQGLDRVGSWLPG